MASIPLGRISDKHLLVLYIISLAENGIPTMTHYQKVLFLAMKTLRIDPAAMYRPNHYGAYSEYGHVQKRIGGLRAHP